MIKFLHVFFITSAICALSESVPLNISELSITTPGSSEQNNVETENQNIEFVNQNLNDLKAESY